MLLFLHCASNNWKTKDGVQGEHVDHSHKSHNQTHSPSDSGEHSCCSIKPKEKTNQSFVKDPACGMYTCPMHPDIRQKEPGSCPICGMALEHEEIALEEAENPELTDFTQRLKVSIPMTVPLLLLAMSDLVPGQPVQHAIPAWINAGIQFVLATPVVVWAGFPFFLRGAGHR